MQPPGRDDAERLRIRAASARLPIREVNSKALNQHLAGFDPWVIADDELPVELRHRKTPITILELDVQKLRANQQVRAMQGKTESRVE
jgi:hypothetical protein